MKELINILKGKRKLLFFDLEGTQETKEIIAIGASKVNLDAKFFIKNFDKKGFKQYVKSNGEIGKFVTDLTNINEKTLKEKGITFEKMIDKFKSYVGKNPEDFLFITYGNFDLKLLHTTCQLHNDYGRNFIDIICKNYLDLSNFSSRFVKDNNFNKCSLVESIVNLNRTPLKNEHDPLVDTKNLIILFDLLTKNKQALMREYKKVLSNYGKYPRPIANILKKLNANQNVTPVDFEKYIEDELN